MLAILTKGWEKLVAIAAVVVAIALVLFGARKAGRDAERAEAGERTKEHVWTRKEVEYETDTLGPDAARQRLYDQWSRD